MACLKFNGLHRSKVTRIITQLQSELSKESKVNAPSTTLLQDIVHYSYRKDAWAQEIERARQRWRGRAMD